MSSEPEAANNTTPAPDSASEGDKIAVLGRLTADQYREMKLAMAEADIRTNDQFVVEAVEAKTAEVLKRRRKDDRKRRRAA